MTTQVLETGWFPETPIEDNLVRRFLHNQAELSVALAETAGGEVLREPGVVAAWYDTRVVYNSMAVLTSPLMPDVLDQVDAFYTGRSATMLSAWPTEDLSERGWVLMGHPMFVVKAPGHLAVPAPPGVTTEVACTAEELALAERLACEGYPLPEAIGAAPNSVYAEGTLQTPLLVRLGLVDGEPVSVAASFLAHDVVNLCLAATLPSGRRRGVWAQLVAARVNDEEHLPSAAITSDDSRPGFTKLGFLPVQRMTMWLRP
ncbi:MAG: hypothetical protein JWP14_2991 [Frankiales bacterium]|nr:hypothetical protein [Frankiales bacterium]